MVFKSNKNSDIVNQCEIQSMHWYKNFLFAVITIAILPGLAHGVSVTSTYDRATKCATIEVTSSEKWNDLEVQCKEGDVKTSFTVSPADWEVNSVVSRDMKTFVKLVRKTFISSDETVVLCYNGIDQRGGQGDIEVTFDGVLVLGDSGPGMLALDIPTLTEWGMIIFIILLFGWMAWVIVNRRKRAVITY